MGKDVYGMIEDFRRARQDLRVMKALRKARCTASLIPDHYPGFTGDANHRIAEAYSIAYTRALLQRAHDEVG